MSILDSAKEVAKAVHEINNLELYQRVLNLHSDIVSLVEENIALREDNKQLKALVAVKKTMAFREPFFYQEGDKTPFCPSCWETKVIPVHVVFNHDNDTQTRWDCPSCKHMYLIRKNRGRQNLPYDSPEGGPDDWMA
jgi:hypothetical protein